MKLQRLQERRRFGCKPGLELGPWRARALMRARPHASMRREVCKQYIRGQKWAVSVSAAPQEVGVEVREHERPSGAEVVRQAVLYLECGVCRAQFPRRCVK